MTETTHQPVTETDEDRALKAKHRTMWALGDYPAVATEIIPALGPVLVEASGIGPGSRVLDVAAGSGNVAIPAARAGAQVIASDLTPELLEEGERQAAAAGVTVEWRTADAESLPFAENTFDAVLSCVGVMFAPHHQASADELVRVCRSGGTLGLISWTPEGFIGQLFATMKPYVAPPPPGAQPPPLWGKEEHVTELFGDRVQTVSAEKRTLRVEAFAHPQDFRNYFKQNYGPTIAAYRGIADDSARTAQLDADLLALGERYDQGDGGGTTVLEWEYLLYTATKR
jgi:ubiquinone/menaquinone biosynthesis C-methylase UbiE